MRFRQCLGIAAMISAGLAATAQQVNQPELKIDSSNRTLTVTADENISVEPEIAVLHIGFDTQLGDAKTVYADGARTSNAIVSALKQAGVPETSIRSESQYLDRDYTKPHKFKLTQQWTVKVAPERAAEILDIAVTAGATSSGNIEWTVKDEQALEEQALDRAASRAKRKCVGTRERNGRAPRRADLRQQPDLIAHLSQADARIIRNERESRTRAAPGHRAPQSQPDCHRLRRLRNRVDRSQQFRSAHYPL